ncbi:GNAT family N-acetyltransferase [Alteriqipengyuania flavescens]|uniref:GNAT family N-acetyltransferase n=1 Tax=Alteriqipengyuania flavescens TaxID=3053610 RepID=UPI0025B621A0|nr:GNAT family N-acetyltransferase [Alteriqipengyuania flavescens]WJY19530.1 GNAT family N-acetyltransferase [Alteriqipengyuania flavescens]WJY25471.1 GNAT family N-acetyltransferase [Alteriqipengyuania flavescens]
MSAPFLVTERLELWLPEAGDWRETHEIISHPETARYLGPPSEPARTFERFQKNGGSWLLHGYGMLLVREAGERRIIGQAGIFHTFRDIGEDFDDGPEAGWIMRPEAGGKGLASEAMRAIYAWFDTEFGRRSVCMITRGNAASVKLAETLGFTLMRSIEKDGDTLDLFERRAARADTL